MIEVNHLTYTYPRTDRPALRDVSFHVEPGELLGFLGPSGAGKSTAQRVLIGLLRDYSGSVSVLGKAVSAWNSDYYERIGVSFEFPNHFLKLTALENLTYFSRLYEGPSESPQALLELVGLAEDGDMPVAQYSKGMKNRLSVARSLLNRPELLFLDEPTAGLDPGNARRIKNVVKAQKAAGKTVFLTTHDMTVAAELCDRVAFIVDGRVTLIDRPRDLERRFGQPKLRVELRSDGNPERAEFPLAGLGANAAFLDLLRNREVTSMHTLEATLEEVFIQVTGRGLS